MGLHKPFGGIFSSRGRLAREYAQSQAGFFRGALEMIGRRETTEGAGEHLQQFKRGLSVAEEELKDFLESHWPFLTY